MGDLVIGAKQACTAEELRQRTKEFALRIVGLARALPPSDVGRHLGRQVLRAGTSVAANYRAACRGRSRAEFVAKLGIAVEEADETVFWLGLLADAQVVPRRRLQPLLDEARELLFILSASRKTAKLSITKSPNRTITKCSASS